MVWNASGQSRFVVAIVAITAFILTAAWSWLISDVYAQAFKYELEGDAEQLLLISRNTTLATHLSWYVLSGSILLAVVLLSPMQTTFQSVVRTRPVSAVQSFAGEVLPLFFAAVIGTLILSGPAAFSYFRQSARFGSLPVGTEMLVLLIGTLAFNACLLAFIYGGVSLAGQLGIHQESIQKLFGMLLGSAFLIGVGVFDLAALFTLEGTLISLRPILVFDQMRLHGDLIASVAAVLVPAPPCLRCTRSISLFVLVSGQPLAQRRWRSCVGHMSSDHLASLYYFTRSCECCYGIPSCSPVAC